MSSQGDKLRLLPCSLSEIPFRFCVFFLVHVVCITSVSQRFGFVLALTAACQRTGSYQRIVPNVVDAVVVVERYAVMLRDESRARIPAASQHSVFTYSSSIIIMHGYLIL